MSHLVRLPTNNITKNDNYNNEVVNDAINSINDAICIINVDNYVTYINKYFTKLFGISSFEIINRKVFKVINNVIIYNSIKLKSNKKGVIQNYDGKNLKINTNIIYNDNGEYNGIIVIASEDTETNNNNVVDIINDIIVENPYPAIKSNNNQFISELKKAYKASKTNATILITGESGTGKEIIAREIHESSKRANGKFVAVNCGAIPENLIESYLFGHKKGSFTGALNDEIGKFEYANGGTIFLDEIGELPLNAQVKLLRVIQERKISKIGSNKIIDIDIRIIAATNSELKSMVNEGSFREDLYYRVNVIPLNLIPLRNRSGDVLVLLEYFKNEYIMINGIDMVEISDEAIKALCEYEWPGNVRELKNIIERIIVLADNNYVDYYDLPSVITNYYKEINQRKKDYLINYKNMKIETFATYEKEIYKIAYEKYGSFNATGKVLGVTHKTVASKLRKYNLI